MSKIFEIILYHILSYIYHISLLYSIYILCKMYIKSKIFLIIPNILYFILLSIKKKFSLFSKSKFYC